MRLSELRELYKHLEKREFVENAIQSISNGYVSVDDIINENYLVENRIYYSCDDYVLTYDDDVMHIDDVFYCDGMDSYFPNDDACTAHEGRYTMTYSRRYINRAGFYYYDGEYYDNDALDRHDLVWCQDYGEIWNRDDCYYHESDGSYYSYEEEDNDTYVRGYHHGSCQSYNFGGKSKYRIGFEIEKEDEGVLESINIYDFENETGGYWRKEQDNSLGNGGYELISPTFEFNINKIFEHITQNDVLVEHINAEKSSNCGGHINLSEQGLNGQQLFDKIKGYTPLLYSLYHGRVDKHYCKGKKNDDLQKENEKYQAIKIHSNRVEFRIISAVPNVDTLMWRSKLIMMILQHPTDDVIKAYYNVDTKFTKLLSQVYSPDRLQILKTRFKEYTQKFENITI